MARPCGCRNIDATKIAGASGAKVGRNAKPGTNGVYELSQAPGCFQPYEGDYRRDSVYVVGLGTPTERLFYRNQRDAAIAYAKETDQSLLHLPAHNLCHTFMEQFFAA